MPLRRPHRLWDTAVVLSVGIASTGIGGHRQSTTPAGCSLLDAPPRVVGLESEHAVFEGMERGIPSWLPQSMHTTSQ